MPSKTMWLEINLPEDNWTYLETCARIRQTSMRGLVSRVLSATAEDYLVRAILDDESQPVDGRKYRMKRYALEKS